MSVSKNIMPALLTKSLTPQELVEHRANIGALMEVAVLTFDRFGWRDIAPAVRKKLRQNWMDALENYPVSEIEAAIARLVDQCPPRCPHQGDVKRELIAERRRLRLRAADRPMPEPWRQHDEKRGRDVGAKSVHGMRSLRETLADMTERGHELRAAKEAEIWALR